MPRLCVSRRHRIDVLAGADPCIRLQPEAEEEGRGRLIRECGRIVEKRCITSDNKQIEGRSCGLDSSPSSALAKNRAIVVSDFRATRTDIPN